ncbi:MAG TPA: TetR/AcrR family transcriptional regulator [Blastocatellia bacterium]|nr:TetR/AcrR family transcriptional regulator [Blastocatellia bacterium]
MARKVKSRPRTKPPEERRNEIMDAAQRLFLKQGVPSTTVEQITSAADVAKGTFYLYFSSKDDVLTALGDRFGEEHLARIEAAVARRSDADWKGKLGAWAHACVQFYLDSIQLHDILFYGSRPATREGAVDNVVIADLCELLKAGADAGAWSTDDPRFTAVFLFSGFHAVVDDAHLKEKRINRPRLEQRLQHLCFRTVGLQPE